MGGHSWLLEWLDTTQMVMVVRKQQLSTLLSPPISFAITISPFIHFLVVPLIRLYSWLLEWLDTIKMVMVVQKQ